MTERLRSEFRFEVTNLLNHKNYVTVNNVYGEVLLPSSLF